MQEKLISFETAKLAKEKGFNGKIVDKGIFWINGKYDWEESFIFNQDKSYARPTQSLLQKWLREVHNLFVYCFDDSNENKYYWGVSKLFSGETTEDSSENPNCNSYEEALELGLKKGLELI